MANKQYASLIRKTFHDRNCLSIYIKQYKSQRQKWKDTKIQEDKMKELQSLQPAVFPLPQHGTMQGFIRLQFLRTKCSERALLSTFWVLFFSVFLRLFECFSGYFFKHLFQNLKEFQGNSKPTFQHGTMQGFIRLQFLCTKCFEKAQP